MSLLSEMSLGIQDERAIQKTGQLKQRSEQGRLDALLAQDLMPPHPAKALLQVVEFAFEGRIQFAQPVLPLPKGVRLPLLDQSKPVDHFLQSQVARLSLGRHARHHVFPSG
ncbi:MAG: hypothetical protein KME03_14980 [Aphanocapsa lilacina HA4352-LM1]|jgi:hypothetical protein|nr:hypothetical protein [Aphanocapsa lilacina HA4352-LM1]